MDDQTSKPLEAPNRTGSLLCPAEQAALTEKFLADTQPPRGDSNSGRTLPQQLDAVLATQQATNPSNEGLPGKVTLAAELPKIDLPGNFNLQSASHANPLEELTPIQEKISLNSKPLIDFPLGYRTDVGSHKIGYYTNPLMVGVPMAYITSTVALEKATAGERTSGSGALLATVGALGLVADGTAFYIAHKLENPLGQVKRGAAMVADIGMMAPLAGLALKGRGQALRAIGLSSAAAKTLITFAPDELFRQ